MIVRPFTPDALPRVSATPESRTAFGPTAAAVMGKTYQLSTSPFGAATISCIDIVAPRAPDDGDVVWALSRNDDERCGYLLLEGMTALRIVAATLGVPPPAMLRRLGAAERGIVTAALASAFRWLQADAFILLGQRSWSAGDLTRLILRADFRTIQEQILQEHVRLDVAPDWLPRPSPSQWLAEASNSKMDIPFTIQLTRTTLKAADWSRARPGDAVVFDDQTSRVDQQDWPAWLVCGEYAAEILIGRDGQARMVNDFRLGWKSANDSQPDVGIDETAAKERGVDMSTELDAVSMTMLASAPIEVVAEIGRFVIRADEVMALKPGSILPLGQLRPKIISLKVGEREWAQGELVDVDGQLGVRLTTVISSSSQAPTNSDDAETQR